MISGKRRVYDTAVLSEQNCRWGRGLVKRRMSKVGNPFRYFNSSPEVIGMAVMLYIRYPLSLRNVEDLLFERGIDICHETVQLWRNRFGPMFAADIRRQRWRHDRAVHYEQAVQH